MAMGAMPDQLGGNNKKSRRNRVKITIKQQAVDGEEMIDPSNINA